MKCTECKQGEYVETSIFDAWDRVLHCNRCGHEVKTDESGRPIKKGKGGGSDGPKGR